MRNKLLAQAITWIAENDNPGDDESADAIAGYLTTLLVADTFELEAKQVAEAVYKLRHPSH